MSFINKFMNSLLLYRSNYSQQDAVIEVKSTDYLSYETYEREEGLFIYGINNVDKAKNGEVCEFKFEVVFIKDVSNKLQTAYSIFRGRNIEETKEVFNLLSNKVPLLNSLCPQLINEKSLQDILNYTKNFPSQTLAHICAHFPYMMPYFKADKTLNFVDRDKLVCPITNFTPLHLAIESKNLELVNFFMDFPDLVDIVFRLEDQDFNNIFHFAANTTKEIISALCIEKPITSSTVPSTSSNSVPQQQSPEEEIKLKQKERKDRIHYLINKRNKISASPLYIACSSDKPECVKALLRFGAHLNSASLVDNNALELNMSVQFDPDKHLHIIDQLDVKEFKNGGTPLHWIKNAQYIECLLDMKCKIDAKNFKGETALHTFVSKKNLAIVMSLLWHGAEVNALDQQEQTPLHLAVRAGDVSIVQALIVFDADVNLKDAKGYTSRHISSSSDTPNCDLILYILHVVNAQRCLKSVDNLCTDGCAKAGTFNGKNKDSPYYRASPVYEPLLFEAIVHAALEKKKKDAENGTPMQVDGNFERKNKRVLCLDGGGIRGLILIQMLSILESHYQLKTYSLFDFISGTSTGGICALAFALERSSKDVRNLYFRLKDKIFTGSRPYDETVFEQFLKKEFGSDTRMSDIKHIKLFVPALKANQFPPEIHIFRNYKSPELILEAKDEIDENDQYVWFVARSSGAAPTYFTSCDKYLDGGLISNNPTMDTLTEITQLNCAYKATGQYHKMFNVEVVVSMGTGEIPVQQVSTPKLNYPTSIFEMTKLYQSFNDLFDLLVEQSTQSNGQVVKRCSAWCNNIETPLYRFNPPISKNILLNETDNVVLVKMLWETTSYMHSKENEILELKKFLD